MGKRRALLIGVPEYQIDTIADIPVVANDLEQLHSVLRESGYAEVKKLGTGDGLPSFNNIRGAIEDFLAAADSGDTLLLYFSGHGCHFEATDYLFPADARITGPAFHSYLVPLDFGALVEESKAETVVFFVDACREGVELGEKSALSAREWGRAKRDLVGKRSYVLVFGCHPGELCHYVAGHDGFSLFTRALIAGLRPDCPAHTLGEVLAVAQQSLDALSQEHGNRRQQIRTSLETAAEDLDAALARVICDAPAGDRPGAAGDSWSLAVAESRLWRAALEGRTATALDGELRGPARQAVAATVAACRRRWDSGRGAIAGDPWLDEDLAPRVLRRLELLVIRSDPPVELSVLETALLLAAPFVHQGVLAAALAAVGRLDDGSPPAAEGRSRLRADLEKARLARPQFARKVERLEQQGLASADGDKKRERDAVDAWLAHRAIRRRPETWMAEPDGTVPEGFESELRAAAGAVPVIGEALAPARLLALARCLFADPERVPRALSLRLDVGADAEAQAIREQTLGHLLALAAELAIDAVTLDSVIVDHIGLADPLRPAQVHAALEAARWTPRGSRLSLSAACRHQALDLALHGQVAQAAQVLDGIQRRLSDPQPDVAPLAGLPARLDADGIVAAAGEDGAPRYTSPHVRFRLAQDEVRELLMGERLYGDPSLAIRELYQNALDACRYRRARLEYLGKTGEVMGGGWQGKIVFRQATDDAGRAYLECRDNGVGMGRGEIEQCFARAGRRFTDTPEYLEEQAEWLRLDQPVRLYPNSQFGIGVFSYFMLADEIEIETCRFERDGTGGEPLLIRISGSGSLFRIRPLPGTGDRRCGTRIRLYLNRGEHDGEAISCRRTLLELLHIAEFQTEVHGEAVTEVWAPGVFRHPSIRQDELCNAGHPDVWWMPEKRSLVLADGIRILPLREAAEYLGDEEENKWPRFLVIDLRQQHRPRLTLDRKKILDPDPGWIDGVIQEGWRWLLDWKRLTLAWLWQVSWPHSRVALAVAGELMRRRAEVEIGMPRADLGRVAIDRVGFYPGDEGLVSGKLWTGVRLGNYMGYSLSRSIAPSWLVAHRVATWRGIGVEIPDQVRQWLRVVDQDAPVPEPYDSFLLSGVVDGRGSWLGGEVPPTHLAIASAKFGLTIGEVSERLRQFEPLGLRVPTFAGEAAALVVADEDLMLLSRDLDSLGPWLEGEVPAIHLVIASGKLGLAVGEVSERLRQFGPLGLKVPTVAGEAAALVLTDEDLRLLSRDLVGRGPWLDDEVPAIHLAIATAKLGLAVGEVSERLRQFEPLGLKVPMVAGEAAALVATDEEFMLLSRYLDSQGPWLDGEVPEVHLMIASGKLGLPVGEVSDRLRRFEPLGLKVPDLAVEIREQIPTEQDLALLRLTAWKKAAEAPRGVFEAALELQLPVSEVLRRLERWGLQSPAIDSPFRDLHPSHKDAIALSSRWNKASLLEKTVSAWQVVLAAVVLDEPLATTRDRIRKYAEPLGLTLPQELEAL